ncbi:MAG: flagellar basal-body rod protein FlgF [Pseudohongiellaceae bacterium]|jgi:flagellar basal-body rod protein FlgF
MDKAIYIAMSAGQNIMSAQAIHANNLANASTTGFQSDFAQARSMGVYYGDGHSTRAYAMTESPGTNFNHGALIETGRDLDLAIDGDGWLAVQAKDGREAYTRGGSLRVSPTGQLITGNNLPVMGEGGPIAIPPFEKLTLGADGTITIQPEGQAAGVLAVVDRVKLVRPNYAELTKGTDGLVSRKDGEEEDGDSIIKLQAGFLESSNVDAVGELTQIMALARQYEINIKLMKNVDENSRATTSLLKST